jgi:hypothetical protein
VDHRWRHIARVAQRRASTRPHVGAPATTTPAGAIRVLWTGTVTRIACLGSRDKSRDDFRIGKRWWCRPLHTWWNVGRRCWWGGRTFKPIDPRRFINGRLRNSSPRFLSWWGEDLLLFSWWIIDRWGRLVSCASGNQEQGDGNRAEYQYTSKHVASLSLTCHHSNRCVQVGCSRPYGV